MINLDPEYMAEYRRELLAEAERVRLAALLPRRKSNIRRELAEACYRLADWLDDPAQYVRPPETGRGDWAKPWASV